jgi:hypothetical protein
VDYHSKERIEGQNSKITLSGRSKRNIPLPIFKNEPMAKITNTYKSLVREQLKVND